MKYRIPTALPLVLALGLGAASGAWAAGAISEHTSESGSIELSNLDGADTPASPAAALAPEASGSAGNSAAAPHKEASKAASGTVWSKRTPNKKSGDPTDATTATNSEANNEANSASDSPAPDNGNATATDSGRRPTEAAQERDRAGDNPMASGTNGGAQGAGYGGGYGAVYGGGDAGANAAGNTNAGAGLDTPQTAPVNSASNNGSLRAVAGGLGGVGSLPTPTSPEQVTLAQYRQLMMQEATAANFMNTNPAISRRYLAVDRTTYQTRIGQ